MQSSGSRMTENKDPKWCERCQTFHRWTPPFNEQALIDAGVQAIADEIDREILEDLFRKNQ